MSRMWLSALLAMAAGAMAAQAEFVPDPAFKISGDPAKGAATYTTYCALCHGATGAGDGPGAAALNPKPRALSNKEEMAKVTDHEIFTAIKMGGAAVGKSMFMVAWGAVLGNDDQKVHDVAAYVRTLAK